MKNIMEMTKCQSHDARISLAGNAAILAAVESRRRDARLVGRAAQGRASRPGEPHPYGSSTTALKNLKAAAAIKRIRADARHAVTAKY